MSAPSQASATDTDTHGPRRAWAAVSVLAVVGTLNYADRFLPAVLTQPVSRQSFT